MSLKKRVQKFWKVPRAVMKIIFERTLLMRFVGQGAEIDLSLGIENEIKDFTKFSKEEIRTMFDEEYKRLYGRASAESPCRICNIQGSGKPS